MISLAVAAADWVGLVHPEITPPSNFHHLRDTTGERSTWAVTANRVIIPARAAAFLPYQTPQILASRPVAAAIGIARSLSNGGIMRALMAMRKYTTNLTHQLSDADPLHRFNLVVEPRSLSAEIILVDVTRLLDKEIK